MKVPGSFATSIIVSTLCCYKINMCICVPCGRVAVLHYTRPHFTPNIPTILAVLFAKSLGTFSLSFLTVVYDTATYTEKRFFVNIFISSHENFLVWVTTSVNCVNTYNFYIGHIMRFSNTLVDTT